MQIMAYNSARYRSVEDAQGKENGITILSVFFEIVPQKINKALSPVVRCMVALKKIG